MLSDSVILQLINTENMTMDDTYKNKLNNLLREKLTEFDVMELVYNTSDVQHVMNRRNLVSKLTKEIRTYANTSIEDGPDGDMLLVNQIEEVIVLWMLWWLLLV